ncbi:MAG: hypothetical protein AB1813_10355 [Verrucomicrobiota bacterium]
MLAFAGSMKTSAFLLTGALLLTNPGNITAQEPKLSGIQWQTTFGSAGRDYDESIDRLVALLPLREGGFLFAGDSRSKPGGTKTSPHFGGFDFWVIRTDAQGTIQWDRAFGGNDDERLLLVAELPNGTLRLGGHSLSRDSSNKSMPAKGAWLLDLDASGEKLLERVLTQESDPPIEVLQTALDGSFFAGATVNPLGPENPNGADFWILRVNANGERIFEMVLGGPGPEKLSVLQPIADGGVLLGGNSASPPGRDKSSPYFGGLGDYWIVRLDAAGFKLWENSFGGEGEDRLHAVVSLADGGFLIGGSSNSLPGGNKSSPNFGSSDFWIVRVAANGARLWDRSYGGGDLEELAGVEWMQSGGFLLSGSSSSAPGASKLSAAAGLLDYWLVRIDSEGRKLWEKSFGGADRDQLAGVRQLADGGLLLGGSSESPASGIKTAAQWGGIDFWVLRLEALDLSRLFALPPRAGDTAFQFVLRAELDATYAIEISNDARNWTRWQTNRATRGDIEWSDPELPDATHRFYRALRLE